MSMEGDSAIREFDKAQRFLIISVILFCLLIGIAMLVGYYTGTKFCNDHGMEFSFSAIGCLEGENVHQITTIGWRFEKVFIDNTGEHK